MFNFDEILSEFREYFKHGNIMKICKNVCQLWDVLHVNQIFLRVRKQRKHVSDLEEKLHVKHAEVRALDEPVPEETASVCRALYVLRHGADPEGWAGCQALLTDEE